MSKRLPLGLPSSCALCAGSFGTSQALCSWCLGELSCTCSIVHRISDGSECHMSRNGDDDGMDGKDSFAGYGTSSHPCPETVNMRGLPSAKTSTKNNEFVKLQSEPKNYPSLRAVHGYPKSQARLWGSPSSYDAIRLLRQLRLLGPGGLACPITSSKVSTRCCPTSTQAIKKLDQTKSRMKAGRELGLLKYAAKAISSIPR